MHATSTSSPGKRSHRIAEQILSASAPLAPGCTPAAPRLSREEIEDLVSRTLDRELARLETTTPAGSA